MEIIQSSQNVARSNKALKAGWIISTLCIAFLLFDAIMKIIRNHYSIEGSVQLGWPENLIQSLGLMLLVCTILYSIPKTAILGGILLTGYLGGAIAIMVVAGQPIYFPLFFCLMVWLGLYLRDDRLRFLIPLRKEIE